MCTLETQATRSGTASALSEGQNAGCGVGTGFDQGVSRRAPEAGERTEEMGLGGHCIIGQTGGVLAIM